MSQNHNSLVWCWEVHQDCSKYLPLIVMSRARGGSFTDIDEATASGVLSDVLKEYDVYLGGSSMGKGLEHAAKYYLRRLEPIPEKDDALVESFQPTPEDPFYIVDIGVVVSQIYQWRKYFPRVEPFYAVKCNPDPVIIRALAVLGANFDCASRCEIEIVQKMCKDLDRTPEIIYANPCKGRAHGTSRGMPQTRTDTTSCES